LRRPGEECVLGNIGAPGRIRTPDPQIRSLATPTDSSRQVIDFTAFEYATGLAFSPEMGLKC